MKISTIIKLSIAIILTIPLNGISQNEVSFEPVVNLKHVEHLQEEIVVNDKSMRIVHIYCEAPDYHWVGDDDEGFTCVDDVARAARLYLNRFDRTGDQALLEPTIGMLRFVLYMQSEEGDFYNFMLPDYSINKSHVNSVKSFNWWAARGFRAITSGVFSLKDTNPEFHAQLKIAAERSITRMNDVFLDGDDLPEMGSDLAAELVLGLVKWSEATGELESIKPLLDFFNHKIIQSATIPSDDFPFTIFLSWRNVWHGWGQQQVEALALSGQLLNDSVLVNQAKKEADSWHKYLISTKNYAYFEMIDGLPTNGKRFSQIAYDINCLVQSNLALYKTTNEQKYAKQAGLAAAWFYGNNPLDTVMYSEETGRGYDGINSETKINRNSGAESTIEALIAIEALSDYPETWKYIKDESNYLHAETLEFFR
jgi:hypothetical protein